MSIKQHLVKDLTKDDFQLLFRSPRAISLARSRTYRREFNEVLPGLNCDSRRYIEFIVGLQRLMESHTNYPSARLRSYSGWKAAPAGHTMVDNAAYIEAVNPGAPTKFKSDKHREIFSNLIKILFEKAKPASIRIPSKSSQGLPTLTTDRSQKVEDVLHALDRLEEIFTLVNARDGRGLIQSGIVPCYVQNYRTSPDKFGKQRLVPDLQYALTGGAKGRLVQIDYFDGVPDKRLQACRPRRVMGMHNVLNSLVALGFSPVEEYFLSEYSFTYKHQDYDRMTDKAKRFFLQNPVGVDVSAFDLSVPRWLFDEFFKELEKYFSAQYVSFLKIIHFAPVFEPPNEEGGHAGFIGNPFELEELPSPGLLSGIRTVSTIGKVFNTFNLLCMLHDSDCWIGTPLASLLIGDDPDVAIWNAGDDCLLFFREKRKAESFRRKLSEGGYYFKVEEEKPISFLGGRLDTATMTFEPNLDSFLLNTFVPERPWTSKLRAYWQIGIRDRDLIYSKNSQYREVRALLNREFSRVFNTSFDAYAQKILVQYPVNDPNRGMISDADRMFLANPASIHYKLDAKDVSPHLLADEVESLTFDTYASHFSAIYRGHIIMS